MFLSDVSQRWILSGWVASMVIAGSVLGGETNPEIFDALGRITPAAAGTYSGLVSDTALGAGTIELTMTRKGSFTALVHLESSKRLVFIGQPSRHGGVWEAVSSDAKAAHRLRITLLRENGVTVSGSLEIHGQASAVWAPIHWYRLPGKRFSNPGARVVLLSPEQAPGQELAGCFTFDVSPIGFSRWKGVIYDGKRFVGSGWVSRDFVLPVFLRSEAASLWGAVNIQEKNFTGPLHFRTVLPAGLAREELLVAEVRQVAGLEWGSRGKIEFEDGRQAIAGTFSQRMGAIWPDAGLRFFLTVQPREGAFSGAFVDPTSHRSVPFQGVLWGPAGFGIYGKGEEAGAVFIETATPGTWSGGGGSISLGSSLNANGNPSIIEFSGATVSGAALSLSTGGTSLNFEGGSLVIHPPGP